MTLRAATYCRISDDKAGQGLGVERQRQDCEQVVLSRGWAPVLALSDNDVSAYSGKPRPGYARLLEAVRDGQVDVVVAWHPDRLHRSPRELEDFISLVEARGVAVETVQAGSWDLSSASGRQTARILGAVARGESEHKSDRVRRALQQRAESGRSHGRRPYGWTSSGDLDEAQADVVREAAGRIVQGHSLRSIVADLNARGVPSPAGKAWGKVSLRAVVLRERNAGLLVRHGQVVGQGGWPAILEPALWEQVRAVLSDPARRSSTSSAAAHLLSGIARCGLCEATMRAGTNRGLPVYRCSERSCVSRSRAAVDAHAEDVLLRRLKKEDAAFLLVDPARRDDVLSALAEVDELEARLARFQDDYFAGYINGPELKEAKERLRPTIEAAQVRARQVDDSPLLADLPSAEGVAEWWEGKPLTQRRAIMSRVVTVTVWKAQQGARTYDVDAVKVIPIK